MSGLIQVTMPHLCVGVIVRQDRIVQAVPILAWSKGKTITELAAWALSQGGGGQVVERDEDR